MFMSFYEEEDFHLIPLDPNEGADSLVQFVVDVVVVLALVMLVVGMTWIACDMAFPRQV